MPVWMTESQRDQVRLDEHRVKRIIEAEEKEVCLGGLINKGEYSPRRDKEDLSKEYPSRFKFCHIVKLGTEFFHNVYMFKYNNCVPAFCFVDEKDYKKAFRTQLMRKVKFNNLVENFDAEKFSSIPSCIEKCFVTKTDWQCWICLHLHLLLKERHDKKFYESCWHVVHENCERLLEEFIDLREREQILNEKKCVTKCYLCKVYEEYDFIIEKYYS